MIDTQQLEVADDALRPLGIVAQTLSSTLGTTVPLLGQVPFDVALRTGGDNGEPIVRAKPESPAAVALREIAAT
ncbi:MAG: hypothetical protein EBV35_04930, partial [Betaproteobacteria bacterium]|nr:hypothetical protein [Betaproteobacteria bacterium]